MREPRNNEGSLAPLFERLAANPTSSRMLDRRALLKSVHEDVIRLLNTRTGAVVEPVAGAAGTVLDYGLPDFAWAAPVIEPDQQEIADIVARRVAEYEPRLVNVRATATGAPSGRGVNLSLSASLRIGSVYEPVTFAVDLDQKQLKAEVG